MNLFESYSSVKAPEAQNSVLLFLILVSLALLKVRLVALVFFIVEEDIEVIDVGI